MLTYLIFFFFNDTATTEIYTLSLHDALPISSLIASVAPLGITVVPTSPISPPVQVNLPLTVKVPLPKRFPLLNVPLAVLRSEVHTSELQSRSVLAFTLLPALTFTVPPLNPIV